MSTLKQDTRSRRVVTVTHPNTKATKYDVATGLTRLMLTGEEGSLFRDLAGLFPGTAIKISSGDGVIAVTEEGKIGQFGWTRTQYLVAFHTGLLDFVGDTDWDIDLV